MSLQLSLSANGGPAQGSCTLAKVFCDTPGDSDSDTDTDSDSDSDNAVPYFSM